MNQAKFFIKRKDGYRQITTDCLPYKKDVYVKLPILLKACNRLSLIHNNVDSDLAFVAMPDNDLPDYISSLKFRIKQTFGKNSDERCLLRIYGQDINGNTGSINLTEKPIYVRCGKTVQRKERQLHPVLKPQAYTHYETLILLQVHDSGILQRSVDNLIRLPDIRQYIRNSIATSILPEAYGGNAISHENELCTLIAGNNQNVSVADWIRFLLYFGPVSGALPRLNELRNLNYTPHYTRANAEAELLTNLRPILRHSAEYPYRLVISYKLSGSTIHSFIVRDAEWGYVVVFNPDKRSRVFSSLAQLMTATEIGQLVSDMGLPLMPTQPANLCEQQDNIEGYQLLPKNSTSQNPSSFPVENCSDDPPLILPLPEETTYMVSDEELTSQHAIIDVHNYCSDPTVLFYFD